MRKVTFEYFCTQLQPLIEKRDTHLRCAITVKHRYAITLWLLAEYFTIAHLFGVGRSTVCEIVH